MSFPSGRGALLLCLGLALGAGLPAGAAPAVGDCVVFREGGEGRLLKTPTYWMQGKVVALATEHRRIVRCPVERKPYASYTRDERLRLASVAPCGVVDGDGDGVDVVRARIAVEAWETPWSIQHGAPGLLFRGTFLGRTLTKGGEIDILSEWLEPCGAARD